MRELRKRLRQLLPDPMRERYHRYALRGDFGIDREKGTRRPVAHDPRRPAGLNVVGYFESSSGVGQSARSLADAAEQAGISVARVEVEASTKRGPQPAPYDVNLYHVNADGAASIVEELGPGLHAGRANVAYWYWESESFPERWMDRFDYLDEVWVGSALCRRAVADASPLPVALVPPAVKLSEPPADVRSRAGFAASDFLFLTVLDALTVPERKNPLGAVRAFARAFPDSPNVLLHLQIRNADDAPGLLEALREAGPGGRVSVSAAALAPAQVQTLPGRRGAHISPP